MRVLHISSGNLYGGIESMLSTMARHREECAGLEQQFGLCFEGRAAEELRETGAAVHVFGSVRLSRPSTVMRARRELRRVLRTSRFDAVVCHAPWALAVFGAAIRGARLPLVLWLHSAHSGKHWIERLAVLRKPSLVIANSAYSSRFATKWLPNSRHVIIYCPVETFDAESEAINALDAVRAELATPLDSTVVILAARMEALKGHEDLLRCLGEVADRADWCCWIVGGPQRPNEVAYRENLLRVAQSLGIGERVRFVGERRDVFRLLRAADIYCQPNTAPESFGISFVEAMRCGLPVLSTAIGGAVEVVDETCGILVPSGDRTQLTLALRRLLTDASLRTRLGSGGPARARALCSPQDRLRELFDALQTVNARAGTSTRATTLVVGAVP